jgi:hypothetical protein
MTKSCTTRIEGKTGQRARTGGIFHRAAIDSDTPDDDRVFLFQAMVQIDSSIDRV